MHASYYPLPFFRLNCTSYRTSLSFYFIGLAILASALPFSLEMLALRNLTPLSFGTLMSLEPAVAALSGFIFLGEYLLWNQWLALATIITASVGCTITTQKARQEREKVAS